MSASAPPLAAALESMRQRRYAEAETQCRNALIKSAHDPRVHTLLAGALREQGRYAEAAACIAQAQRLDARFAPAWLEAAALARAQLDIPAAVRALEHALTLSAPHAGLLSDLASTLAAAGNLPAARARIAQASALTPQAAELHFLAGNFAFKAQDYEAAVAHYSRCVALRDDVAAGWLNRGEALLAARQAAAAAQSFARASQLAPNDVAALDGQARALVASDGGVAEFVSLRGRIAALQPTAVNLARYGIALWRQSRYAEAAESFDRAIASDPRHLLAHWARFQYPRAIVHDSAADMREFRARWLQGLEFFEALDWHDPHNAAQAEICITLCTPFFLHYLGDSVVAEMQRYGTLLCRMATAAVGVIDAETPSITTSGRLRIGFFSAYFGRHTITKLFGQMIVGLPRDQFEVCVLHHAVNPDDDAQLLGREVDRYLNGERTFKDWAHTLRELRLNALIYLDIGMHPMAQSLAALRLAPLQAMLWGHPVTTGLPTLDVALSSDAMEPADGERHYRERLVRLPRLGTCYEPPALTPETPNELRDIGNDVVDIQFAQSAFKITPDHDVVFARIAQAVPNARFHFTPHGDPAVVGALRERLRRSFDAYGLDLTRHLGVFRAVSQTEFLGIAQRACLNLDALHWSGGNTTLEILAFDVPTITLPGATMRSRHTAAMLELLELPELIARDVDDYVRIAVRLATNANWRATLRATIAARKHRLYRDRGTIAALADFLNTELLSANPR